MLADSEGWAARERELVSLKCAASERVTALEAELAALTQAASRQRDEVSVTPGFLCFSASLTLLLLVTLT